ncbi:MULTISPECIES: GTPase [Paraburkholderia]|uniref:GTPase n=1 Tax=Paraburkholderia TaxID=1822464 RepID=UPI000362ECDB|nr:MULTISPECIES: GTPase domain-containing protein [Paraburkholderia]MDH6150464.1 hypothetical protein [Paraburkholderia sp. WSM4179]
MSSKPREQAARDLASVLPDRAHDLARLLILIDDSEPVVTVVGKYNHGKSSLLNELLGRDAFAVSDRRETVRLSDSVHQGVRWLDAPGLDADVGSEDDREALRAAWLKSDIRLFVHAAKEGELDAKELTLLTELDADRVRTGRQTLFVLSQVDQLPDDAALLDITGPALAYKRRKRVEVLLHHLEENGLGSLQSNVLPLLGDLGESSQGALARLEQQQEQLANVVWRGIVPTLPALLDAQAATHDVIGLCNALSQSIFELYRREADRLLGDDYLIEPDASVATIELADDVGFDDIVVGRAGANGAVREVADVDYGRLRAALSHAIRECVLSLSGHAAQRCRASIAQLTMLARRLEASLAMHEEGLLDRESQVRSETF